MTQAVCPICETFPLFRKRNYFPAFKTVLEVVFRRMFKNRFLHNKLKIISLNNFCLQLGIWGLFAGPLLREGGAFASKGSPESLEMLMWNAIGLVVIISWNGLLSFVIFYFLKKVW